MTCWVGSSHPNQAKFVDLVPCEREDKIFLICHVTTQFKCQPSKHLLVFKTSWRRLEDMSWRRLQHVFSVTIFRLPRRLEDISQDVLIQKIVTLKTSWRRLEEVLKTCLEDVLETNKMFTVYMYLTMAYQQI